MSITIFRRAISLLRSKNVRILLKLYEPFIYSLCLSIVTITFSLDYFMDEGFISQEKYEKRVFLMSLLGGCSLPTIIRVISYSSGLCKWYMANVFCLLLNNIMGFLFFFNLVDYIIYMFSATGLSCIGIISFLVFRIFYRVTDEVCCHRRQL